MRIAAALVTGVLLLTACTGPVATSPTPQASVTSAATTATPSAPVTPTATPTSTSTYTGARAMPASDGKPMLWPVGHTDSQATDSYGLKATRYGFVDITGKLVVPQIYEDYQFCDDATGRAAWVITGAAGAKADVLDLSGAVVAHTPTADASCGPPGQVIFTKDYGSETWQRDEGLLDIATGRVIVPLVRDRHIAVVDSHTVNVSDPTGEYFLDIGSGRRTPHVGWLTESTTLERDAPGLPASTRRRKDDGSEQVLTYGFVGLSGKWVKPAQFEDAQAFVHGNALVSIADVGYAFLDTRLQRWGDVWTEVETVGSYDSDGWHLAGYLVSDSSGQSLLRADLSVVTRSAQGSITCAGDAAGACSMKAADGSLWMVVLPEGTTTPLPPGFPTVLSRSFVVDGDDAVDRGTTRVLALASGTAAQVADSSFCVGVGAVWAACEWGYQEPKAVFDLSGRRTPFASIDVVYDPAPSTGAAYYMATTLRYEGLVDAHGDWVYRKSRFTRLED